jgi:hypothetical protein
MADAGKTPGADDFFRHKALEQRTDMIDEGRIGRQAAGEIGSRRDERFVGDNIGM